MPVEPLDTAQHNREDFSCGVEGVDRYFQAVARQAAEKHASQSYVLVPPQPRPVPCEVIGYYTLVAHTYRDPAMDATTAKALKISGLTGSIPMILLGQLGIGIAHQGRGVGAMLLREALRRSLHAALSIGGVAIITDPINAAADAFYQKHGFNSLIAGQSRLYIPTAVLARYNPDVVAMFKNQPQMLDINFGTQHFLA